MEQENNQKKESYEIQTKLSIASGFKFGLGLGMGFFMSALVIGFILFTIFAGSISIFLKAVSDPFGIKNNYPQTIPDKQSPPDIFKYFTK